MKITKYFKNWLLYGSLSVVTFMVSYALLYLTLSDKLAGASEENINVTFSISIVSFLIGIVCLMQAVKNYVFHELKIRSDRRRGR